MTEKRTLYVVQDVAAACWLGEKLPGAAVCAAGGDLAGCAYDEVVYLGGRDVAGFKEWWSAVVLARLSQGGEVTVSPEDCTPWAAARGLCDGK